MHMSAYVTNAVHQHYFDRGLAVSRPGTGEVLYVWINLDSTYPPSEVLLEFQTLENNGAYSWEHRAYWGTNSLSYGLDGTPSRTYMGPLPAPGQWIQLRVDAKNRRAIFTRNPFV